MLELLRILPILWLLQARKTGFCDPVFHNLEKLWLKQFTALAQEIVQQIISP